VRPKENELTKFILNQRLEQDSVLIGNLRICQIRIINDARWPWLILVPEIPGAEELHDLNPDELNAITADTFDCATALKQITGCEKINSGSLGNVVRQLHIHVVARSTGDANWPGPVWGFGTSVNYETKNQTKLIAALKTKLF
jgi:diadenosine tetraphosphate (Ap4A) HIT family hydrolase